LPGPVPGTHASCGGGTKAWMVATRPAMTAKGRSPRGTLHVLAPVPGPVRGLQPFARQHSPVADEGGDAEGAEEAAGFAVNEVDVAVTHRRQVAAGEADVLVVELRRDQRRLRAGHRQLAAEGVEDAAAAPEAEVPLGAGAVHHDR